MPNVTGVVIPDGIDGEQVRAALLAEFNLEIGTSFGPLRGRIWRIGTMGYNANETNVLFCLSSLEAVLRRQGFRGSDDAAAAAQAVFRAAEDRRPRV